MVDPRDPSYNYGSSRRAYLVHPIRRPNHQQPTTAANHHPTYHRTAHHQVSHSTTTPPQVASPYGQFNEYGRPQGPYYQAQQEGIAPYPTAHQPSGSYLEMPDTLAHRRWASNNTSRPIERPLVSSIYSRTRLLDPPTVQESLIESGRTQWAQLVHQPNKRPHFPTEESGLRNHGPHPRQERKEESSYGPSTITRAECLNILETLSHNMESWKKEFNELASKYQPKANEQANVPEPRNKAIQHVMSIICTNCQGKGHSASECSSPKDLILTATKEHKPWKEEEEDEEEEEKEEEEGEEEEEDEEETTKVESPLKGKIATAQLQLTFPQTEAPPASSTTLTEGYWAMIQPNTSPQVQATKKWAENALTHPNPILRVLAHSS